VNRKVLSLEAAGQLRVPQNDDSHIVHPTEPSQFDASLSRPASAQVIGFMGRAFTATIFGIRKRGAECRTSPCHGHVLFEGHTPIACGSAYLVQLERLIQGRLPRGLQPVQNKIAARGEN
jgi:hypothetical protein